MYPEKRGKSSQELIELHDYKFVEYTVDRIVPSGVGRFAAATKRRATTE